MLVDIFVAAVTFVAVVGLMNVDLTMTEAELAVVEVVLVESVAAVVDMMSAFIVVVSHSLQVLEQCVTLAT